MKNLNFTQGQIKTIFADLAKEKDGFNKLLKLSLNAMMEAERKEYNNENSDTSNGFRERRILGAGEEQIILDVPRSRYSNFYPKLLLILNNREEEAKKVAFKLYKSGLTTEQIGEIFHELYGKYYSKSQVSRMFNYAREQVTQWLERPLEAYYPIVYIDAIFISTRRGDSVSKEAYYIVLGVKPDRTRDVLGIINYPTENSEGWKEIIGNLKQRGVKRIDLFVSDARTAIENAISYYYSKANIQFCAVHLERNVLKGVKKADRKEIAKELKEVFLTNQLDDSIAQGWQRWIKFVNKNKQKYPHIKRMTTDRYRYYFTYLKYNYKIRQMIYTTNWIERLNKDFRRATRMRGSLPSPEATILLLGGVSMDKKNYKRKVPLLDYDDSFDWEI